MQINAALGVSSMFTRGGSLQARQAFERGLELALELGDALYALGLLGMLNIYMQRIGDYPAALEVAKRGEAIAQSLQDPIATMASKWMLGVSYHLFGDHSRSHANCESALLPRPTSAHGGALRFLGYDYRARALAIETVSLWLRGYHDRAIRVAQFAVDEAERAGQPIAICVSYLSASCILQWSGDTAFADNRIEQVIAVRRKIFLGAISRRRSWLERRRTDQKRQCAARNRHASGEPGDA